MFPVAKVDNLVNPTLHQFSTQTDSGDIENRASTSVDDSPTFHNSDSIKNNVPGECPMSPEPEKSKTPAWSVCNDDVNTTATTKNDNDSDSDNSSNDVPDENAAPFVYDEPNQPILNHYNPKIYDNKRDFQSSWYQKYINCFIQKIS